MHWEKKLFATKKRQHELLWLMAAGDPVKYDQLRGTEIFQFWFQVWSWDNQNRKKLNKDTDTEIK